MFFVNADGSPTKHQQLVRWRKWVAASHSIVSQLSKTDGQTEPDNADLCATDHEVRGGCNQCKCKHVRVPIILHSFALCAHHIH